MSGDSKEAEAEERARHEGRKGAGMLSLTCLARDPLEHHASRDGSEREARQVERPLAHAVWERGEVDPVEAAEGGQLGEGGHECLHRRRRTRRRLCPESE